MENILEQIFAVEIGNKALPVPKTKILRCVEKIRNDLGVQISYAAVKGAIYSIKANKRPVHSQFNT